MSELHTLYRFFDRAGGLLYVGITNNPARRLGKHKDEKAWWRDIANVTLEHFPSRDALRAAERAAIQAECPTHNILLKSRTPTLGSAETPPVDDDPLVGMWFHSWTENDGRSSWVDADAPLKPDWQGQVIRRVSRKKYLVQTYSWWDGTPSPALKIALAKLMDDWTFYPSSLHMKAALGCSEYFAHVSTSARRHGREGKCNGPATHMTGMGQVVCHNCAVFYSEVTELEL